MRTTDYTRIWPLTAPRGNAKGATDAAKVEDRDSATSY